jgi:hypothetical protein
MSIYFKKKKLTCDVLQKRSKHSACRCNLCKVNEEIIHRLILTCASTTKVWEEVEVFIYLKDMWRGNSIEETLRHWCGNNAMKICKALPLIIAWL